MTTNVGVLPESYTVLEVAPLAEVLLNGRADAMSAFTGNLAAALRKSGKEPVVLYPSDYRAQHYGKVHFVHADAVEQNASAFRAYLHATIRGWQYILEAPTRAQALLEKWVSPKFLAKQTASVPAKLALLETGVDAIGVMRSERWKAIADMLVTAGTLPNPLSGRIRFTNALLPP